jgi:hypothetical protein
MFSTLRSRSRKEKSLRLAYHRFTLTTGALGASVGKLEINSEEAAESVEAPPKDRRRGPSQVRSLAGAPNRRSIQHKTREVQGHL